jgi:hypothetical protein
MTDDELEGRVRAAMRGITEDVPADLQPPVEFWARIEEPTERGQDIFVHRRKNRLVTVGAPLVVACAATVALIATSSALLQRDMGAPPFSAHSSTSRPSPPSPPSQPSAAPPSGSSRTAARWFTLYRPPNYEPKDHCVAGAAVTPLSDGSVPGATWDKESTTAVLGPDGQSNLVSPLRTRAFDEIVNAGGCVQAWILPAVEVKPEDCHPSGISGSCVRQTATALTEVYVAANGSTYVARSGNVDPQALAAALTAATRS